MTFKMIPQMAIMIPKIIPMIPNLIPKVKKLHCWVSSERYKQSVKLK